MIVEIENDIIKLKGKITKNLWPATLSGVEMLIGQGYENIIVDCSEIESITPNGLETFSAAFTYLTKRNLKLYFVSVNDDVLKMARQIPGIRSSMPIGDSIEDVRNSIKLSEKFIVTKKCLIYPVLGNPSHAIMFVDLYGDKDVPLNFVYPMIVPLKYNLYQPLKFLENKASADLVRLDGFCIFNNRQSKNTILRVRSYRNFLQTISEQYTNGTVLFSFANCDMEKNQNKEKLKSFIEIENLNGLVITEPKGKPYYDVNKNYEKLVVIINGNKDVDNKTLYFLHKVIQKDSIVEFIKLHKIAINEKPMETLDYIENFKVDDLNCSYKTISVRSRSNYLKNYVEKNEINALLISINKNDGNFVLNLCEDPLCTTLFVK